MSDLYPKIHSPYKRFTEGPQRNKLDRSRWFRDEFGLLADLPWHWTEKVDGTNIRIIWDGHRVQFGGRTSGAQIPATLFTALTNLFPEELLEQQFGASPAILHGEGYGPKIQKGGGNYRADQSFILFDVQVDGWWLLPDAVSDVADSMNVDRVPVFGVFPFSEAVGRVEAGLGSQFGDFYAEGMVGRPPLGLAGRDGDRLLVKVKHVDFFGGAA